MTTPGRDTQPTGERSPRLTSQRPLILTGVIVIAILVATVGAAGVRVARDLPTDAVELAAEVVLALVAIGALTRLRAWRDVGFRRLATLRDLRLFWVPLFPVLPALPGAVAALSGPGPEGGGLARLGFWLALAALVGFVEEVAFRGLILRALAPRGVRRAAVISSVLFGLMHTVNLLFGVDPGATLLQVGSAMAMGFAFAAVALRTGVLWPLVVIHALVDVVGFITADGTTATAATGADVLVAAVYAAMFTVYGVLVLRTVRIVPGSPASTARELLA